MLEILMIEPFAVFKYGSASFASKDGPKTFTAKISMIRLAVTSASGVIAPAPALFTGTSRRPQSSKHSQSFVTRLSALLYRPRTSQYSGGPWPLLPDLPRLTVIRTLAPFEEKGKAVARPIPKLPPVMMTTLSLSVSM